MKLLVIISQIIIVHAILLYDWQHGNVVLWLGDGYEFFCPTTILWVHHNIRGLSLIEMLLCVRDYISNNPGRSGQWMNNPPNEHLKNSTFITWVSEFSLQMPTVLWSNIIISCLKKFNMWFYKSPVHSCLLGTFIKPQCGLANEYSSFAFMI